MNFVDWSFEWWKVIVYVIRNQYFILWVREGYGKFYSFGLIWIDVQVRKIICDC